MNTSTTSIVGADAPPTPRAADWQIKVRYSGILHNRHKNAGSEPNFIPSLCAQSSVGVVASDYLSGCGSILAIPSFCGETG